MLQNLPLPVAELLVRARCAKSSYESHENARHAWEASLKLHVAANRPTDPKPLLKAQLGDWVRALTPMSRRSSDERLRGVFRLFVQVGRGEDFGGNEVSHDDLMSVLPAYRDRTTGHGAVREPKFYRESGPILAQGLLAT